MAPEGDQEIRARIAELAPNIRAQVRLPETGSGYRSGGGSRTLQIELEAGPTYAGQFVGVLWLMLSVVLGFGVTKLLGMPTHGRAAGASLAVMSLVAAVVGLGPMGYLLWRPRRRRVMTLSDKDFSVRGAAWSPFWGGDIVHSTTDLDGFELRAASRDGDKDVVALLRDGRRVIVLHGLAARDCPERTLALLEAFRKEARR